MHKKPKLGNGTKAVQKEEVRTEPQTSLESLAVDCSELGLAIFRGGVVGGGTEGSEISAKQGSKGKKFTKDQGVAFGGLGFCCYQVIFDYRDSRPVCQLQVEGESAGVEKT